MRLGLHPRGKHLILRLGLAQQVFFNRVTIGIYKESAQAKAGALPLMGHRTPLIQPEMSSVVGSREVRKGLSSHPMVSIVLTRPSHESVGGVQTLTAGGELLRRESNSHEISYLPIRFGSSKCHSFSFGKLLYMSERTRATTRDCGHATIN